MTPARDGHAAFCDDVQTELVSIIGQEMPLRDTPLHAMAQARGQMLRTRVLFEAADAAQTDRKYAEIVRLAAGVELLHLGTLVHDDFVDGASVRRDVPTLAADERALVIGLMCIHRSVQIVTQFRPEYGGLFARRLRDLAEGQLNDVERASSDVPITELVQLHARKTGALFAIASELGALCNTSTNAARLSSARKAGEHLGVAYQVLDDIREVRGDATGKTRTDLRNGISLFAYGQREASLTEVLTVARENLTKTTTCWQRAFGSVPQDGGVWCEVKGALDGVAA